MNLEIDTAIKKIDADWLEKNGTSTQEHQLLRAIKSIGGSVSDIAKFWIEIGKDTVPSFVKDLVISLKNYNPDTNLTVTAPSFYEKVQLIK